MTSELFQQQQWTKADERRYREMILNTHPEFQNVIGSTKERKAFQQAIEKERRKTRAEKSLGPIVVRRQRLVTASELIQRLVDSDMLQEG